MSKTALKSFLRPRLKNSELLISTLLDGSQGSFQVLLARRQACEQPVRSEVMLSPYRRGATTLTFRANRSRRKNLESATPWQVLGDRFFALRLRPFRISETLEEDSPALTAFWLNSISTRCIWPRLMPCKLHLCLLG